MRYIDRFKVFLKKNTPTIVFNILRFVYNYKDFYAVSEFLFKNDIGLNIYDRVKYVYKIYWISLFIESPHTQSQIINFATSILKLDKDSDLIVVEAGCYKGSSTAKFSIAAKLNDKKLFVFDSFEGLPKHNETHTKNIFGGPISFEQGDYRGSLDEVKENVSRFGYLEQCEFVKGYFNDTMQGFNREIGAVYIDVDLASSTKTCIENLYPLLKKGGILYSQDGHIPLVVDVFKDKEFWEKEVGYNQPKIYGLEEKKLIYLYKEE